MDIKDTEKAMHTPGPWTASPTRKGILGDPESYRLYGFAITAEEPKMYGGTPVAHVSITRRYRLVEWSDETAANAALIAAAPAMKEALIDVLDWYDEWMESDEPGKLDVEHSMDAVRTILSQVMR